MYFTDCAVVKDLVKTSMALTFKSFWKPGNYIVKNPTKTFYSYSTSISSFFFFFLSDKVCKNMLKYWEKF